MWSHKFKNATDIVPPSFWKCDPYSCEAARVNTMTGGLDLSFGFPWNGKIPYPHQVTWSQPINYVLSKKQRESWKACEGPGLKKARKSLYQ